MDAQIPNFHKDILKYKGEVQSNLLSYLSFKFFYSFSLRFAITNKPVQFIPGVRVVRKILPVQSNLIF